MFRDLKMRLTLINVTLLSIVLFVIFCGMYMLIGNDLSHRAEKIMSGVAKTERIPPSPPNAMNKRNPSNFFFIRVSHSGEWLESSQNVSISKDDAQTISSLALAHKSLRGDISYKGQSLWFLKAPKEYGSFLVFLDKGQENDEINRFILVSLIIGTLSLAMVFGVSLFLANKALVPVHTAWKKQQDFVADASHELRTPLAIIQTNLDLVCGNPEETIESQAKWLQNMQHETKRMAKLMDDLLFLARTDGKDEAITKAAFDLSQAIEYAIPPFEPMMAEKNMTLTTDIIPDVKLFGNVGRLTQLLAILMDNALKFSHTGGNITIRLQCHKGAAVLSVADQGEGIDPKYHDKIFERFFRIDKSRTRSHGGTGLGLSIAHAIVLEHGGNIHVQSEVGKGTKFVVTLPLNK